MEYNHKEIEKRWQAYWKEQGTYRTREDGSRKKFCSICFRILRERDCMWVIRSAI